MMKGKGGGSLSEILYEDAALLVCVKPRGILSAKDASGKPSMADLLAPRTLYPVHRLDRQTVGLMVFAKTAQSAAALSRSDSFVKEYLAVCEGCPAPAEGELRDLLFYDRTKSKTFVVKRSRAGVKEARLSYRVLAADDGAALLRIRLFTGRTHQIRAQLSSRGHPLLGDRRYGAKSGGEMQLYAFRLSFPHPNGTELSFTLPADYLTGHPLLVGLP